MPRDGSGNYTLPAGNPVVTGTLIESAWANPTMSDFAVQFNNVLTRDGLLGPVNPFKLADGAVATPGLTWNSEPGLGWYRSATNVMSIAAVNARVEQWDYSTAADVVKYLYPRAAGATSLRLDSNVSGSANTSYFQLRNTTTESRVESVKVGTGTMNPLIYQGVLHKFQNTDAVSFAQFNRPSVDSVQLTLNKGTTAGSSAIISSLRNSLTRWDIQLGNATAEAGGNSGSDFVINRYNDAGAFIEKTLTIRRSDGGYVFNSEYGGFFVVMDETTLSESFRTSIQSPGGVPNETIISGQLTYRANPTYGAVAGAKADFYGDLNFPNTGSPGGVNLAGPRGIGWNTYTTSGAIRVMYLMDTLQGGNTFGFTMVAQALHQPGVDARFRFNIGGGVQVFDMKQNGQGESPGGWVATSDARVKANRSVIQDALWKIGQLTGETYDKLDMVGMDGVAPRKAGYIAQQVQAVLPEAVTVAHDEIGTLSVDHNGLIGLLIEGVKELHARVDQLES